MVSGAATASQILDLIPASLAGRGPNITSRSPWVAIWLDHADWTLSAGTSTVNATAPWSRLTPSRLSVLVHARGIGVRKGIVVIQGLAILAACVVQLATTIVSRASVAAAFPASVMPLAARSQVNVCYQLCAAIVDAVNFLVLELSLRLLG